ncbi:MULTISPECIES: dTDP-4-dehydrorhamnose 3,5-epimerase [unclassified Methanobrevibacter]|jgi:dTDP-4-dehydrorhamnose 3,5-epimerase|uniref:dTDP-4-dehydrorhamnose 3,5-epimerase n=1 Tax=unclassified Methanobrevibacter TaxID=2638681 RepID=UPI002A13CB86|nr:dTDP-4-dehydrorhamnose 3,5-epimerase [Methanobacteriaceae archaeon]
MGKFKIIKKEIEDVFTVEPTVFGDDRGYFMETYNENDFKDQGINLTFVQDNQSKSTKGVLRGLHFQYNHPQGKLVRVIRGKVFDVAVDLRKDSNTYGKWVGETLSEDNKKQLFIPKGFAHGFFVISDEAEFVYKCTDFYVPDDEGGILWNDPDIGIKWPLDEINEEDILLSEKDQNWKLMKDTETNF